MERHGDLTLRVLALDDDGEDVDALSRALRRELLDLDVEQVDLVAAGDEPPGAKGLGAVVGWLSVRIRGASALRAVVGAVRLWSSRTGRTIEVTIGTDVLKVSAATAEQQDRIIEVWLARHAADN